MDSRHVVARFDAERQALALMDHPHVAHVYDAGTTREGRPYFVMEYVPGDPLIEYCDRHKLTTRQRLELFVLVCDAIQHAHQKGIIHRDLKPSNVLVQIVDGKPVPKVIDFGIAKALSQPLTQLTVFTEVGQLIGTPEYMSPEQAEMTGVNIDTRTDIYSLGVILYQLLTGALPFGSDTLRDKSYFEIQRMIREIDPPRPSTRLSQVNPKADELARQRSTDSRTLRGQLRGDLDWITMRALEKDRTRRYAAVSELSSDILRHLRNEPVLAGPPSTRYRVGKFVRRHRVQVAWAAALLVVLVAGLITSTAALIHSVQQRRAAERSRDAERLARELAQRRFGQVHELANTFMFDFYRAIENVPGTTPAKELLVTTALKYLDNLSREAGDDPQLQRDLAWAYMRVAEVEGGSGPNLGRTADALAHHKLGLALIEQLASANPHDPARQRDLGEALHRHGQLLQSAGQFDAALDAFARERDLRVRLAEREGKGGPNLKLAQLDIALGWLLERTGQLDRAADVYARGRDALMSLSAQLPDNADLRFEQARATTRLATALARLRQHDRALELLREAQLIQRELLARDPNADDVRRMLITNLGQVSTLLKEGGKLDDAIAALREANGMLRDMAKADPRDRSVARALAVNCSRLADVLDAAGKPREALGLIEESLALSRRLVQDDPAHLEYRNDLTLTLFLLVDHLTRFATSQQASPDERQPMLARAGDHLREAEQTLAEVLQRGLDPGKAVRDQLDEVAANYRAVAATQPSAAPATNVTR
jgi:tetratricopeptide (TPR) repeat protein